MTQATTYTTLAHKQEIRVNGFSQYSSRIYVGTTKGYALEYGDKVDDSENGAWAMKTGSVITSDFEGKTAMLNAQRQATQSSVQIEDGQIVQIEGNLFTVKVMGERHSDPVHFIQQ